MRHVHIECLPDEHLIKNLGISRRNITHHQGKSRVFHVLSKQSGQVAMVDEDPGSAKTSYEKKLSLVVDSKGIKYYTDNAGNKILFLSDKLEDWIVRVCREEKIKLSDFGLAEKPNSLHEQINQKLNNFDRLIIFLLEKNNASLLYLKGLLQ